MSARAREMAVRKWQRLLERRGHLVTRSYASSQLPYQLHSADKQGTSYLWFVVGSFPKKKKFGKQELQSMRKLVRLDKRFSLKLLVTVFFLGPPNSYQVLSPDQVLKQPHVEVTKQSRTLLRLYACPACHTQYEFEENDIRSSEPTCGFCGTKLTEEAAW